MGLTTAASMQLRRPGEIYTNYRLRGFLAHLSSVA